MGNILYSKKYHYIVRNTIFYLPINIQSQKDPYYKIPIFSLKNLDYIYEKNSR